MVEIAFIVFFISVAVALAYIFVSSIRQSAARKRAGDSTEALHSEWQDWGGDEFGWMTPLQENEPETVPEPEYGVIRIQAR